MTYHIEFDANLRTNTYPGWFLALEGIDGSGKTSQVESLHAYFIKEGREVLTTHWPRRDAGIIGSLANAMLKGTAKIPKAAYQYLFSADYVTYSENVIIPALKAGRVVISDRCHFWSAVAYGIWEQSDAYDTSIAQSLLVTHGIVTQAYRFIIPNVTFFLSVPATVAAGRIQKKRSSEKDIYEKKDIMEKVASGYEWLVRKFPEVFVSIDGTVAKEAVTEQIITKLTHR